MDEGVGHALRSDSGLISAIWPDSVHTCVACASTVKASKCSIGREDAHDGPQVAKKLWR